MFLIKLTVSDTFLVEVERKAKGTNSSSTLRLQGLQSKPKN